MFEILPEIVLSKIVEKLDSKSSLKFVEAANCNEQLSMKLNALKFNVCPFCMLKNISNPRKLLYMPLDESYPFDAFDALALFLYKKQRFYNIKDDGYWYRYETKSFTIDGRYIDEDLNCYTFDQVVEQGSLIKFWREIILEVECFTEQDFQEHLRMHFLCNKSVNKIERWTLDEMNQTIEKLSQIQNPFICPEYNDTMYLKFGSIDDELNLLVASKYLFSNNIIGNNFQQFSINLAKYLVIETLDLLTRVRILGEPTNSLAHFSKQFYILNILIDLM